MGIKSLISAAGLSADTLLRTFALILAADCATALFTEIIIGFFFITLNTAFAAFTAVALFTALHSCHNSNITSQFLSVSSKLFLRQIMALNTDGGKKKPLKHAKSDKVVTSEDIEFKKKQAEEKKKLQQMSKDLKSKKK
ncbi:hypothetical protein HWI79_2121 [Cryptosporidium felis]|nr:hypothetical protein HWI79_2121 [Cryptosporidium felis]